jgi:RsiW-degrading membrane proteinase PrsW (M82 family)
LGVPEVAAAVLAPAAFWIGYFYYKDRLRPEPPANLAVAYVMGFASGFLCFEFYGLLGRAGITTGFRAVLDGTTPLQFFSYAVVFVGLIEETFKFLPFILVVVRFKAFDEPIDGIVYAAALAVGFASFENLGYLPHMKGLAFLGRALASPLTHTVFSSVWGYAIGWAIFRRCSVVVACIVGVTLSGTAHGLFDYLTLSPGLRVFSAMLILVIWIWVIRRLEKGPPRERRQV